MVKVCPSTFTNILKYYIMHMSYISSAMMTLLIEQFFKQAVRVRLDHVSNIAFSRLLSPFVVSVQITTLGSRGFV